MRPVIFILIEEDAAEIERSIFKVILALLSPVGESRIIEYWVPVV